MTGACVVRRIACAFLLVGLSSTAFAGNVTYGYDALGRLTSVTNSNGVTTSYSYDAAGNRTQQIVSVPAPPTVGNVSQTVGLNSSNNTIALNFTGGGQPSSVAVVPSQGPSGGTARAIGTQILYTPNPGNTPFTDTFQYTATNSAGVTSSPATVTITVTSLAIWGSFTWGSATW